MQGAIAVLGSKDPWVRLFPRKKGKIDWHALNETLHRLNPVNDRVFIEKVASFGTPGKGESTSLENYGRLKMLLELAMLPYEEVFPQSWPGAYKDLFPLNLPKLPKGLAPKDAQARRNEHRALRKARLVKIAVHLFPGREYTSGESDALLIAEFGRRKLAEVAA